MLQHLTISGFKTLRQTELEFGRVNIFIGGNGSGKSNILEALGLLSAALKDITDLELQKRGVRLSRPTLFKSAFKNTNLRALLDMRARFENNVKYAVAIKAGETSQTLRFFSENIVHNNTSYMGRGQNGIKVAGLSAGKRDIDPTRGLWDRFHESLDLPTELEIELGRMQKYAIFAPQTAFLRGTEVESLPNSPMGLQGSGLPQAALTVDLLLREANNQNSARFALIRRILDIVKAPGWSERFIVSRFNANRTPRLVKTGNNSLYFIDKYMRANRNILSAYDSSEGTLYLLFIAALLLHPETPKIFALDNVDNALNPTMTRQMLETIILATCNSEYRNAGIGPDQVFLTSHNPTALDAFDIFDDSQRVFVVMREPDTGLTQVQRLKTPQGMTRADWIKKAGGKHLSELWIEGKIKGALGI